jgi:trans-aconitate methyltransferase
MGFNSQIGKAVLARVRGGDYAHPGEEESIRLVWDHLPKDLSQQAVDAGCGRGGTAAFVQREGWSRVSGFDIEGGSIEEARRNYPGIRFEACDVAKAPSVLGAGFDGIYAMTAFYAFPDQEAALRSFRQMVGPGAWLAVMDYADLGRFESSALAKTEEAWWWQPLQADQIRSQLEVTGWECDTFESWDRHFEGWYEGFMARVEAKQAEVEELAGAGMYQELHRFYGLLLKSIQAGDIGGLFLRARAV